MPFCKAYFGLNQMSCFNAGAIHFSEFKPFVLGIDIRVGNGFLLPSRAFGVNKYVRCLLQHATARELLIEVSANKSRRFRQSTWGHANNIPAGVTDGRRSVTELAATATLRLRVLAVRRYPQEGPLGASARVRSVRSLGPPASCHAM